MNFLVQDEPYEADLGCPTHALLIVSVLTMQ